MNLNGRWFPQIVYRDSGNLYPIYPPFLCSDFLSVWGVSIFVFRKTILSHLIFSSHCMLFSIWFKHICIGLPTSIA